MVLSYLGLLCLLKHEGRIWPAFLWSVALLFGASGLIESSPDTWAAATDRLNTGHAGGLLGALLSGGLLEPLLGRVGAAVLLWALLLTSLVMLLQVRPGVLVRHAWEMVQGASARWQEARKDKLTRVQRIEEEQQEVARRRQRLEKALQDSTPAVTVRKRGAAKAADKEEAVEPEPAPKPRARMPDPEPEPLPEPEPPRKPARVERPVAPVEPVREAVPDVELEEDEMPPAAVVAPVTAAPERARRTMMPDAAKGAGAEPAALQAVLPMTGQSWTLPTLEMLDPVPAQREAPSGTDFAVGAQVLKETLAEFGVDVEVTNVERGPVITRYELLPAAGVRVETIAKLNNNIALAMKAETVRVQAPIPGKGVVGIEVPNPKTTTVYLREVLEGTVWQSGKAALPLCLGKDVGGRDQIADLADMPHLLIAGATGSGKTVCMNSVLAGLLMARSPDQMRLLLIDPKIVEFSGYNHLPHLVVPVITDPKKVSLGLRWAITEMEKRYKLFAKVGVRNIKSFNSRPIIKQDSLFGADELGAIPEEEADPVPERVPYIVIVVDELADLMLVAQSDIESQIARLAQLSRAVGIHMILATQRPSVNVITGTIKANFPARISFQVAQKVDSRTILDAAGADKLLGKGDMLFLPPGSPKLIRAQGTLTTDAELHRVVEHWKKQGQPQYERSIKEKIEGKQVDLPDMEEDDGLLQQAMEIIRQTRRASTSSLQRRLRIGYTRAARIMDLLEQRGVVGPAQGADPREILIDLDGEVPANDDGEEPRDG